MKFCFRFIPILIRLLRCSLFIPSLLRKIEEHNSIFLSHSLCYHQPFSLCLYPLSGSAPPGRRPCGGPVSSRRKPTATCPHCEQRKCALLCLCGAHPSKWKWSECSLVNQSIEQTCLRNLSLKSFSAFVLCMTNELGEGRYLVCPPPSLSLVQFFSNVSIIQKYTPANLMKICSFLLRYMQSLPRPEIYV